MVYFFGTKLRASPSLPNSADDCRVQPSVTARSRTIRNKYFNSNCCEVYFYFIYLLLLAYRYRNNLSCYINVIEYFYARVQQLGTKTVYATRYLLSLVSISSSLISLEQMRVFLFGKKGSKAFLTALACNEYNFRAIFRSFIKVQTRLVDVRRLIPTI